MSQRYKSKVALARMARGRCPECGGLPERHDGWGGPKCGLTDNGVAQRIHRFNLDAAKVKLTAPDRWVSVGKGVNDSVSEHRHVVARGALTSACGATASYPQVWRGIPDGRKPRCPECLAAVMSNDQNRVVPEAPGIVSYTRIAEGRYLVLLDEAEIGEVAHHWIPSRSRPLWQAIATDGRVIAKNLSQRGDAADRLAYVLKQAAS